MPFNQNDYFSVYDNNSGFAPEMGPLQQATSNQSNQSNSSVPGASGTNFDGIGALKIGIGSIQALGSLWNSYQQTRFANKSLNFQTRAYDTNLRNQTKSYNTALEDRIRTRYATEGRSGQADGYIERHKL